MDQDIVKSAQAIRDLMGPGYICDGSSDRAIVSRVSLLVALVLEQHRIDTLPKSLDVTTLPFEAYSIGGGAPGYRTHVAVGEVPAILCNKLEKGRRLLLVFDGTATCAECIAIACKMALVHGGLRTPPAIATTPS
jgi:hypothetical protein